MININEEWRTAYDIAMYSSLPNAPATNALLALRHAIESRDAEIDRLRDVIARIETGAETTQ